QSATGINKSAAGEAGPRSNITLIFQYFGCTQKWGRPGFSWPSVIKIHLRYETKLPIGYGNVKVYHLT
ncbi:MAG: hypothetical protein ACAH80_14305, partial [Alphaproteobacteria bacterium]